MGAWHPEGRLSEFGLESALSALPAAEFRMPVLAEHTDRWPGSGVKNWAR